MFASMIETYAKAYRGLPRTVWILSLVMFINRCGTMVLPFLTLYLTQEKGIDIQVAGQVLAVYGLGSILGGYLGGWFCDRLGSINIQIISLVLSGGGFMILGFQENLNAIILIVFLLAVVTEAFRPANGAALAEFCPSKLRARAVAFNRIAINLGAAMGPALGGFLASFDYGLLFWIDGLTCWAAALVTAIMLGADRRPVKVGREEEPQGEGRHPMRDGSFLLFLLLITLAGTCLFQYFSTYPVYLNEFYGFSETGFGLLASLNGVMIIAFEMLLTQWCERFDHSRVMGLGACIMCLGFGVLPFSTEMLVAVASMVIWTVGEMVFIPLAGGFVANRGGTRHRGKYMGLFTMSWGVCFVSAPYFGTKIYQNLSPQAVWYGVILVGFLIWIGFEILGRRIKGESAAAVPCSGNAA